MEISVEISKYPLADEHIPAIAGFIERLTQHPEIRVVGNTMSTQVFGDYDAVMTLLTQEIKRSFEAYGKSIFVCKFAGRNLDPALDPHGENLPT